MTDTPLAVKLLLGWLVILGLLIVVAILSGLATGVMGVRTPPWYVLRFSMWSLAGMLSLSACAAVMGFFVMTLLEIFK